MLSHSLPLPLVTRSIKSSACPHSHVFAFIYFVETEVKQSPSQCCCGHPSFSSVHTAAWPWAGPVTAWMGKRWWRDGGAVVQPAIFSTNLLRNHGAESPRGAAAAWGETSRCLASGWGAEEFGGKPRVIGGCLATPRLRAGAGFTQQPAVVQKRELRGWGLLCRSVLVALVHFSIAAFQRNWRVFLCSARAQAGSGTTSCIGWGGHITAPESWQHPCPISPAPRSLRGPFPLWAVPSSACLCCRMGVTALCCEGFPTRGWEKVVTVGV